MSRTADASENLTPLKRALLALEKMQRKLDSLEGQMKEPIAVIGIGCRAPGNVSDPESFWKLLHDGVDAIREYPRDRGSWDAVYDPDRNAPGKLYVREGGFLDAVDGFDAEFFGISPREAISMDPQHRLLLETSWEALEHAGQCHEKLMGSRTGVFMGICFDEYSQLHLYSGESSRIDSFCFTGTASSVLAGRLSYFLGAQGPSVTLDTACSSSLVAVHLACQSLRTRECDMALAGGVSLILSPENTIYFCKVGALSPGGRCKTFDASADGYARGEGCGVVVLKRLSEALVDGDNVLAVIRGSAINQDGRSNGLTAPNGPSQVHVIRDALSNAHVAPSQVSYVEAHGTGTSLGDPIEVGALGEVYREGRSKDHPLLLGSVKTNFGHLEAAAGVSGLIKVVLSLQHRQIPRHLHFQQLNPLISLDVIPAQIPVQLMPWPGEEGQRFAAVSAFGISGTNAHLVLQEAPVAAHERHTAKVFVPSDPARPDTIHLLPISAKRGEALKDLARRYKHYLLDESRVAGFSLEDICYTASRRRTHHEFRLALAGRSREALSDQLDAFLQNESCPGLSSGQAVQEQPHKVVFVFPGQGSQWLGMGRQLMEHEPVFRQALESCEEGMRTFVNWSLTEQLLAEEDYPTYRLRDIDVIQPTLLSVEIALAVLWRSWGVEPDAVIGHSMGEVGAAHIAGALSLADAMRIICCRGHLLRRMSGRGAMAVVELPMQGAQAAIQGFEDRLSIGVSSSPRSTVLSGDPAALSEVIAALEIQDIFCRLIKIDVATHSPQMDPLKEELLAALKGLRAQAAAVPIYSTVLGTVTDGAACDSDYWVRNMRQPVLFSKMVQQLLADHYTLFIEMSPHPILLHAIQQGFDHANYIGSTIPSLVRGEEESTALLGSLGRVYTLGYPVDWAKLHPHANRCVPLPAYPWQRERFWMEPRPTAELAYAEGGTARGVPPSLLGWPIKLAAQPEMLVWETLLDERCLPSLYDHCIGGIAVLAASTYLKLALAAATAVFQGQGHELGDISLRCALYLPEDRSPVLLQVSVSPAEDEDGYVFYIDSRAGQSWTRHVSGRMRPASVETGHRHSLETLQSYCSGEIAGEDFYKLLEKNNINIGVSLRGVRKALIGAQEMLAEIETNGASMEHNKSDVPISWLDSCFQLSALVFDPRLGNAAPLSTPSEVSLFMPHFVKKLTVAHRPCSEVWCHITGQSAAPDPDSLGRNACLLDESGHQIVSISGIQLTRLGQDSPQAVSFPRIDDWLLELQWRPVTRPELTSSGGLPGNWLILSDESGVGEALAERCEGGGARCVLVYPGETFREIGRNRIQIRPENSSDLAKLFEVGADESQPAFNRVVYLWGLNGPLVGNLNPVALDSAQQLGVCTLLPLIQVLARTEGGARPRVWVVTRGAQPVLKNSSHELSLPQTPLWGLGRVVREEHPELWGGLVDLDDVASANESAAVLLPEVMRCDEEDQVAFRQGQRFVARLVHMESQPLGSELRLRENGAYLITGGLGDIGLQIARWLIAKGARRLILIGRTSLPPRSEWDKVDPATNLAKKITAIRGLESLGAAVHCASVDVANEEQLKEFLESFQREGWPPIRGVFHAAAVVEDKLLEQLDTSSLRRVLRPKVMGSWLLSRYLTDVDYFVLFSSLGSLLGIPGQASYAAANAFLDGLAHTLQSPQRRSLTVNWGVWMGLGFAASAGGAQTTKVLGHHGLQGFTADQGLEALARLLCTSKSQVAVLPIDRKQFNKVSVEVCRKYPLLIDLAREQTAPEELRPSAEAGRSEETIRQRLLLTEPKERTAILLAHLQYRAGEVLKMAPSRVDPHKPLNAFGLTSVLALEFRNRLESDLELRLSATLTFNYPTLERMTPFLAGKMEIQLDGSAGYPELETRSGEYPLPKSPAPISEPVDGKRRPVVIKDIDEWSDEEALRALRRSK